MIEKCKVWCCSAFMLLGLHISLPPIGKEWWIGWWEWWIHFQLTYWSADLSGRRAGQGAVWDESSWWIYSTVFRLLISWLSREFVAATGEKPYDYRMDMEEEDKAEVSLWHWEVYRNLVRSQYGNCLDEFLFTRRSISGNDGKKDQQWQRWMIWSNAWFSWCKEIWSGDDWTLDGLYINRKATLSSTETPRV
jgi:hypothetical protein